MKKKRMEESHILPIVVSNKDWPVLFHHKWNKEGAKVNLLIYLHFKILQRLQTLMSN